MHFPGSWVAVGRTHAAFVQYVFKNTLEMMIRPADTLGCQSGFVDKINIMIPNGLRSGDRREGVGV